MHAICVQLKIYLFTAQVLRTAGYYTHALWVATRAGESSWALDILLDDVGDAKAAVALLDTLPR